MELWIQLTGGVALFALGFLAAAFMFRRQFLKQREVTKEYEKAMTGLFYSIHHDGFNPRLKRIRGCINVCRMHFDSIEKLEEFVTRPGHENYMKLILKELKEVRQWFNKICTVCLEMEKDIIDNAKKYE